MMEGYRKASCPHFPECDGCKLMHGCLYGQGRTMCLDPDGCPHDARKCAKMWDCWYLSPSAPYKLKELMCPVYRRFHIAATGKMLTEHMLPTAELMHHTDLATIILDELERRGEYQKPQEVIRL